MFKRCFFKKNRPSPLRGFELWIGQRRRNSRLDTGFSNLGHSKTRMSVTSRKKSPAPAEKSSMRGSSKENGSSPKQKRSASKQKNVWISEEILFSSNPDKAWAEKFFFLYSLVWPVLFGTWAKTGTHLLFGDLGNLVASVVIMSPNYIIPWLYCPTKDRPFYETFWFKYLLWLFIFTFVATYFWSEYFFDVLGMKYAFKHLSWNLDSVLVGTGKQNVPLMMLFHAWYFFVTYHTCSVVFIRFVSNSLSHVIPLRPLRQAVSTIISALFFSWAEIKFTTMDAIKDQFEYGDMDWALTWGAGIYSCYFIASFPFVQHLDEHSNETWSLSKTVENALAASMFGFILLDLFCQFVVPPYWVNKQWFSAS